MFDMVRIDHFRAFVAFWQVPAWHKTAVKGGWGAGPKDDFFKKIFKNFSSDSFIAEDLGHITPEVSAVIEKFQIAGMRVLQYGFDADPAANPHCLHNHVRNSAVYTGTHDTNTAKGWFVKEATTEQKKRFAYYIEQRVSKNRVHSDMIKLAMSSVSRLAIIPMQDVLGLDEHTRMNRPGTIKGNWRWRLAPGRTNRANANKLAKLTHTYGRA